MNNINSAGVSALVCIGEAHRYPAAAASSRGLVVNSVRPPQNSTSINVTDKYIFSYITQPVSMF